MDAAGHIRVSDAEREAVVARLNTATAEGRLSLDEFSERANRAYASRTWAELSSLVDDLPAPPGMPLAPLPAPPPKSAQDNLPVLAMILGVVSLPLAACVALGVVVGMTAIVLGVLSLRPGRRHRYPSRAGDRRMALTGVITGSVGIALQVAVFAVLFMIG